MPKLVIAFLAVASLSVPFSTAPTASGASPEPPCEVPPELAGSPSIEWCEEELQGWRQELKEEERQEAQEGRDSEAERRRAATLRRHRAKLRREWAHKPTVTLRVADGMALRTIRNAGYPYGWVECKGGRIDRTHWECRANLFYRGLHGGMRVWGAGYKNGRPFYGTQSSRFHQIPISF